MYVHLPREPHKDAHGAGRVSVRPVWLLRLVLALLLLPAVLSGGTASARALLRCEVTQAVHATCCCPVAAPLAVASISRSCCCTRVEVDSALPDGSLRAQSQVTPPLLVALQPAWRGFGARARTLPGAAAPPSRAELPPPTRVGRSLIVLHRRFLI